MPLQKIPTRAVESSAASQNLNIDANTLFLDATNNRVGIGSDSASAKLHLVSTGNTTADGIRLTTGTEARSHNIYSALATGRDLTIAPFRALNITTGSGTTEGVLTLNSYEYIVFGSGSSYTERMRLDSAGRLTKPYQPAFCVSGSTFSGADFLGTTITTNVGFNVSNGRFTAPISGMYLLSFALSTEDTNSHFIEIAVNGSNVANRQLTYGVSFQSATQFVIVNLNAGDYAIARRRDTGYAVYNAVFSGYLLG